MVIQIAVGIMLGFIFLALVTFILFIVFYGAYVYNEKRKTIARTKKRYDFDDGETETDLWTDD